MSESLEVTDLADFRRACFFFLWNKVVLSAGIGDSSKVTHAPPCITYIYDVTCSSTKPEDLLEKKKNRGVVTNRALSTVLWCDYDSIPTLSLKEPQVRRSSFPPPFMGRV